jgi:hypothetical protein
MHGDPMSILAAAHARLLKAKSALRDASQAAEAADKFASEATLELAAHVRRHADATALRGAALKQALKLGSTAEYVTPPGLADDYTTPLREAEHQHQVARSALDELVAEEAAAAKVVAEAVQAVRAAASAVVSAEAEGTISKIIALEAEALQLRGEVEGVARSGVVGWGTQIALSASGRAILVGNQSSGLSIKNDPAWHGANASAEGWRSRFEFLTETNHAPVACRRRRAVAAE